MHEFCKVGIPIARRKRLGLTLAFFAWMKSPSESLSDRDNFALVLQATPFGSHTLSLSAKGMVYEAKLHTWPFFNVLN